MNAFRPACDTRGRAFGPPCALTLLTLWLAGCASGASERRALEDEFQRAVARQGPTSVVASASPRGTGTERLETIWPATPLRGAGGLACHEGRILVTEPLFDRISVVAPDGNVSRLATPSKLERPEDIAVDSSGRLFVVGGFAGALWRRDTSGSWHELNGQLIEPIGVAVVDAGLLVSDCGRGGRLLLLSAETGAVERVVTSDIGCGGRIHSGRSGTVVLPLADRGRVIEVDLATGSRTTLLDGLDLPSAVGNAGEEALVALDAGTGRIHAIPGLAPPSLSRPMVLEPGLSDVLTCGATVVFANGVDGSLSAFRPFPGPRRTLVAGGLVVPSGMFVDGRNVFVADRASIKRLRDDRMELIAMARPDRLPEPVGLTGGLPGIAWATSPEAGELIQIDLGRGEATRLVAGLDWPTSVLRTPGGELIVVETGGGRVVRIGEGTVPYSIGISLLTPLGLAARGERILTAETTGGRVLSLREEGLPRIVSSGLEGPAGLATAPRQPLYVAEAQRGSILARRAGGSESRIAEGFDLRPGPSRAPLPVPLAVAADGSLFVASPQDGSVTRIVVD